MSIDRIYREFSGFSLIILSLFLFVSLLTFSAQDNVENLLTDSKIYINNFDINNAYDIDHLLVVVELTPKICEIFLQVQP